MPEKRRCKGTTRAGKACSAYPLTDSDFCLAHSDEERRASVGFTGEAGKLGGRPRKPRVVDVLREKVEDEIEEWLEPLYEARKATKHVVVGNGPTAHVEEVPDIPTRLAATREVIDRTHGKARQSVELSGADGGPVKLTFAELAEAAAGNDE